MKDGIIIIVPLLLAACHTGPSVSADNASANEVDAKIAAKTGGAPAFLSPGHYDAVFTITKMDMPGLPPAAAASMQKEMGKATKTESCLTEAEAKKPAASFFAGEDAKECRYDHFTMGGGALDAAMTCKTDDGGSTMSIKGTYSGDGFHLAMTTAATGKPGQPASRMSMAGVVDAHRTGACTGKEDR